METVWRLVIGWTLVGAFVTTTVLTLLSLTGIVTFKTRGQQKALFRILCIQLTSGLVAAFLGWVSVDPAGVVDAVQKTERMETLASFRESSEVYYGLLVDRIQDAVEGRPEDADRKRAITGAGGLDTVKAHLGHLNSLYRGRFDDLVRDEWRPAADVLWDTSKRLVATPPSVSSWAEYQAGSEYRDMTERYKAAVNTISDSAIKWVGE